MQQQKNVTKNVNFKSNNGYEMSEFIEKSQKVIKALDDAKINLDGIEIVLLSVASVFAGISKTYTVQQWIDTVNKVSKESFKNGTGK